MMADGDVPLVKSFTGNEIEFGANGTKVTTRANSRFVLTVSRFSLNVRLFTELRSLGYSCKTGW